MTKDLNKKRDIYFPSYNGSNDEFEDARERESQESTLLEREWLPEEEIDVQGPISRIFTNE